MSNKQRDTRHTGTKRTSLFSAAGIALLLLVVLIAGLFSGCGCQNTAPADNGQTEPSKAPVTDTNVKTLEQLQELMQQEGDLEITVNTDLEMDSSIIVVGNKTVTGTGKLVAVMGSRDTYSMFDVQSGAFLQLEGVSMDGNATADGITIQEGGKAEIRDVTISWPYQYGVAAHDDALLVNVSMDNCPTAAVLASGGTVTVSGGTFTDSHSLIMYVEKDGTLNLEGDPVLEGSAKHGITNRGLLSISGGSITDCVQYSIVNYGHLTMAYEGKDENGTIKLGNNGKGAIYNYAIGTTDARDLEVFNNGGSGISNNGRMTLADSSISDSGTNGIYNTGVFNGKKMTVNGSNNCGIYNMNPGNMTLDCSTIQNSIKRGVHNKGGKVTLEGVSVLTCGTHGIANTVDDYDNPGEVIANNITVAGSKTSVCNEAAGVKTTITNSKLWPSARTNVVVTYGTMLLDNTQILGTVESGTYCLQIAKGAECTFSGNGIITGAAARGVTNHGTLVISGGDIYGNKSTSSGGGVYTDGTLYLAGGSIHDNTANGAGGGVSVGYSSSDSALVGKLYMTGGEIYGNTATSNGGGVYISKGTSYNGGDTVYCTGSITGGSIHDNKAQQGTAVMFSADGVLGGDVKIGSESDVRLNKGVVLQVSQLNQHSQSNPVRIAATGAAGTVIMEAKDEATAEKVLKAITPTSATIGFEKSGNQILINAGEYVTTDGPDMTGAEIVEVSDFQKLKEAVEGASSGDKLIVKVTGNINMEGTVTAPVGASVVVTDNGSAVTLLRGTAMTAGAFFDVPEGAVFVVQGTAAGNMTLDGNNTAVTVTKAGSSLLNNNGELHVNTVTLKNNYAAPSQLSSCYGGLIYAGNGIVNVTDSTLTGGNATNGGAIFISTAQVTLRDTVISDCEASASGGAIRYQGGILVVEGGSLTNNTGSAGGAIAADNAVKLTMTGTKLENNIAQGSHGGAIYLTNGCTLEGTELTFTGNHTEGNGSYYGGALGVNSTSVANLDSCSFIGNYCDHTGNNNGGAIYAGKDTKVTVSGISLFEDNYVTGNGGAIYGNNNAQVKVQDQATFTGNEANSGGAAYVTGYTLDIEGAAFKSNKSGGSGGSLYVSPGDTTTKVTVSDSSFEKNTAGSYGGVINVAGAGSEVSFTDCSFTGNTAKTANDANTLMVSGSSVLSVKNVSITPANAAVCDVRVNAKGVLNVAGKCELGTVKYAANTSKIHVTEALSEGSAMKLLPAAYTEGDVLASGASADVLADAVQYMQVVADAGQDWIVNEEGKLEDNTKEAFIGQTEYKTLAQALAEVQPGQTIVLNSDVSSAVTIPTDVILDGKGKTVTGNVTLEEGAQLKDVAVIGDLTVVEDTDLTSVTVSGTVSVPADKKITVGGSFDAGTVELAAGAKIELTSALGSGVSVTVNSAVQTVNTVILTGDAELVKTEYKKFNLTLSDGTLQLGESGKISAVPFEAIVVGKQSYGTLEEAVTEAAPGDAIQITNSYTLNSQVEINKKLTITSATGTACTISRGGSNTAAVFNIVAGGDLTLTNITVDGGNITASKALVENAGIFTLSADAALIKGNNSAQAGGLDNLSGGTAYIHGTMANNTGKNGGAARNYDGATMDIGAGALFESNTSTANGGAIHQSGIFTVVAATFRNNTSEGSYSGAIHVGNTGSTKLTGTIFTGNKCTGGSGGIMYISGNGAATVENISVTGIAGTTVGKQGGAFLVGSNAKLEIKGTGNVFQSLQAEEGGVIYNNSGTVTIAGGSFTGNTATTNGGVIVSSKGTVTINDGTFTGNTAQNYGGVLNTGSTATIYVYGGSFTGNTSTTKNGGAIHVSGSGTLVVTAGTFTGNFDQNDPDVDIWLNNITTSKLDLTGATEDSVTFGLVSGTDFANNASITNPNGVPLSTAAAEE